MTSFLVSRDTLQSEASKNNAALVQNQREYIDLQHSQIESLAVYLSSEQTITDAVEHSQSQTDTELATRARIGSIIDSYLTLGGLVSIDIFSTNGAHYQFGGTLNPANVRSDLRDQFFGQALQSDQRLLWLGVEDNINGDSNHPKVITAVRVLRKSDPQTLQSRPIGMLVVNYSIDAMYEHFSKLSQAEGSYFILADSRNRILYHPNRQMVGQALDPGLASKINPSTGNFTYKSGSQAMIATFTHSTRGSWLILSLIPVKALFAPTDVITRVTFIVLALSVLFVALVGWFVSNRLVQPIREITSRFKLFEEGSPDWQCRLEVKSRDEIGELASWFNSFQDSLAEKQAAEHALRESEARYRTILQDAHVAIWEVDYSEAQELIANTWNQGSEVINTYLDENPAIEEAALGKIRLVNVNDWSLRLFEAKTKEELSAALPEVLGKPGRKLLRQLLESLANGKTYFECETINFTLTGKTLYVITSVSFPTAIEDHKRALAIITDITERKRIEEVVREREQRYALAVRGANDGIWDWDLRSNQVYYSSRWKAILGYSENEISDTTSEWFGRIHPDDLAQVKAELDAHVKGEKAYFESEHRVFHKAGRYHWVLTRGVAVKDEENVSIRMAGSMTDITARKVTEERLLHDAMHDPLTGLPNRAYFIDQIIRAIQRSRRHKDYMAAVLLLDLDRFRIINDSLGHSRGDQLLIILAHRLKDMLRMGDSIARFGGDEFIILLEDVHSITEIKQITSRMQEDLSQPFDLSGQEVFSTVSIGIAIIANNYERAEDLLRDADTALNQAKANGRARYQIFESEMHARSVVHLQLESELRRALERNEFELYYQPIVDLTTRKISKLEALIRWQHPTRGMIMPGEFIALAEETGLIVPVGEWVLETASRQVKAWRDAGFRQAHVSVNISAEQLQDSNFSKTVKSIIERTGVDPESLSLEVTESAASRDIDLSVRVLEELTRMGLQISIDDFGISYSSLGQLSRFPVSSIKIDQSFVRQITRNNNDEAAITTAIIAMGHILKLVVIAEGVENVQQLDFLASQQCDAIQGYLASYPKPAEQIYRLLQEGGFLLPSAPENGENGNA